MCTAYYPELSREMAMRIGDEYSSDKVTARNFEQLAEQAGLGKPLVKSRVAELSEKVLAALGTAPIVHPVTERIAALIRQRSENAIRLFRI